ncbi:MAG: tRNA ((6)-)-methyltransferase [Bacteroidetes bacterium]|nr:tRNA ((6)-)-methyltransferase [Bacteroidota bacterium]
MLDKCAMKVNTDGVLLGAWADVTGANTILDIGTGTGVLAMMLAQKNQQAHIDAIDIDEAACLQAGENFDACLWQNRLSVYHVSLQDFSTECLYDVIISNPPYFIDDSNGLDQRKNFAKHSITITYEDLVAGIDRLLAAEGRAFIVLPLFNLSIFKSLALACPLHITQCTEVTAVTGKSAYLALIELRREKTSYITTHLQIQNTDNTFTGQYKGLTRDFYLKF